MKILVTGITGQTAAYLARGLLADGHTVYGLTRRVARAEPDAQFWRLEDIGIRNHDHLILLDGDLTNYSDVAIAVQEANPDFIYHLGAQSDVALSFRAPFSTFQVNAVGTQHVLEATRRYASEDCRVYIAGTSEMYGGSSPHQSESSPWAPLSPYAASKCAAASLAHYYRNAYRMFVCVGMLFNHESPLRGMEFVTRKIVRAAALIALEQSSEIRLGNIEAKRDWGYADDYVGAMRLMISHKEPSDFVIATGESHSVRDFCDEAFAAANVPNWEQYLIIDESLKRPADVKFLCGDPTRAKAILNWWPRTSFKQLVTKMVKVEIARVRNIRPLPEWL